MRSIATLAVLCALAGSAAAQVLGPLVPGTPTLRREAIVAGDVVHIGDLIENAGVLADTPIFRAPNLGETGAVETFRVMDAVRPFGLIGVDTRGISEVTVTRPGRIVASRDIETVIAKVLVARYGLGDVRNLTLTFDHEAKPIHLEQSAAPDLRPTRIVYERGSARFDLTFEIPGSVLMRGTSLRYTGSAVETREAAVLVHPLARGEVVKPGDIVVERRSRAELGDDASDVAAVVIGLAARRPLRAGQPLRSADLMKPELVQRGDPVTLVYEVPGVFLTIRGKALETGAEGDLINVVNGQSKRTIQGIVSGPGRVSVGATTSRLEPTAVSSVETNTRSVQPRRTE